MVIHSPFNETFCHSYLFTCFLGTGISKRDAEELRKRCLTFLLEQLKVYFFISVRVCCCKMNESSISLSSMMVDKIVLNYLLYAIDVLFYCSGPKQFSCGIKFALYSFCAPISKQF